MSKNQNQQGQSNPPAETDKPAAEESKLQQENADLKAQLAAMGERLAKLEADQGSTATAIDKLSKAKSAQSANAAQVAESGSSRLKNTAADPEKAAVRLADVWSREKTTKPPTSIETKSFDVTITPTSGAPVRTVTVDNCYDESDAKRTALHSCNVDPRNCTCRVKPAA